MAKPQATGLARDAATDRELVAASGTYRIEGELASGGMATVYLASLVSAGGFTRTVAIKRLHPHLAKDDTFRVAFLDEARLVARIRHPNVVPVLDVVSDGANLSVVMEYVHGVPLSQVVRRLGDKSEAVPPAIAVAIMSNVLEGLHGAHSARDELGPLRVIHRDVSPQNILIGADGIARVLDFGVAKAAGRVQTTRPGELKGKLAYMAPEQILLEHPTSAIDVYAAGVVLWEALAGRRLFQSGNEAKLVHRVLTEEAPPLRSIAPDVPEALAAAVHKAMERRPTDRFASAQQFALAIERAVTPESSRTVAQWVESLCGDVLAERAAQIERGANDRAQSRRAAPQHPGTPDGVTVTVDFGEAEARETRPSLAAPPPKRSRRALVVWAAVVAAILALSIPWSIRSRHAANETRATTSAAPPPVDSTPPAIPLASAASAEMPSPPPIATASTPRPAARITPPRSVSTTPSARPARLDCDPPYWPDPKNPKIKHWKPECVGN